MRCRLLPALSLLAVLTAGCGQNLSDRSAAGLALRDGPPPLAEILADARETVLPKAPAAAVLPPGAENASPAATPSTPAKRPVLAKLKPALAKLLPSRKRSTAPAVPPPPWADEIGTATYYAERFNGRRTASGEVYDPELLTGAHTNLPFGTRVRVVNLVNDREVTVTVNDRCRPRRLPFIDLSREAARQLGFLGHGRVRVRIIPLGAEGAKAPAAEEAVLTDP